MNQNISILEATLKDPKHTGMCCMWRDPWTSTTLPCQVRRLRKLLDDRSFTWERSFRKLCWQRIKTACFNMFFAHVPSTLLKINDMQRCSIFNRIQSKSGGCSVVRSITGEQRRLLSWIMIVYWSTFQKGVYWSETYLVYLMLYWVQIFFNLWIYCTTILEILKDLESCLSFNSIMMYHSNWCTSKCFRTAHDIYTHLFIIYKSSLSLACQSACHITRLIMQSWLVRWVALSLWQIDFWDRMQRGSPKERIFGQWNRWYW